MEACGGSRIINLSEFFQDQSAKRGKTETVQGRAKMQRCKNAKNIPFKVSVESVKTLQTISYFVIYPKCLTIGRPPPPSACHLHLVSTTSG